MELAKLTNCEQVVMKVIWEAGEELGLMDVVGILARKYDKDWKPQTVSTFLARLNEKGYVNHYRKGRVFFYKILVKQEEYEAQLALSFLQFWHHDSVDEFLSAILSKRSLRPAETEKIKELITEKEDVGQTETGYEWLFMQ